MSHAKFSTAEMQQLYALQVMQLYKIKRGYFIIDDTMQHHTNYCKWIHGVFVLFDHVLQTNLKAICIVVLYYSDGELIKFPLQHKIYYKDTDNMPWQQSKQYVCISKYDLAVEMLEWALNNGFPHCIVLADSWFGIGPFIKELKRLKLSYVVEIKDTYTIRMPCKTPKLTPKGRLAKNQYDIISLPNIFKNILTYTKCGFLANKKESKERGKRGRKKEKKEERWIKEKGGKKKEEKEKLRKGGVMEKEQRKKKKKKRKKGRGGGR